MNEVIVYKRVAVSDSKAIVAALRDGYMVLMPESLNRTERPEPAAQRIARVKRSPARRRGPAPTEAKRVRDMEIVQLRAKGWRPTAIGKRYGLSCPRVCQILKIAAKKGGA